MGGLESSDPAILVEDVAIYYRRETNPASSLKEFVVRFAHGQVQRQEVKALDGVTLGVAPGEALGILGPNGAGKTTLLRAIAGILRPTKGRVRVWGKVTCLFGVGIGFNLELTGRENIFVYAALLGRPESRTRACVESILDFAELAGFADSPLRTYSSGMIARLGFAVAMAETPEVLILDEALSVGDQAFAAKCRTRFSEVQQEGATLLIVSHSTAELRRLCSRVAWLERGRLRGLGDAAEVTASYEASLASPKPPAA